jgi:chemotaxis protein methyltransferase CheR
MRANDDHDLSFSDRDFERVRRLIHRQAGIALPSSRGTMVSNRLGRRVRELGLSSYDEYLTLVESGTDEERQVFTNALTTNLTAFFREAHHFPILADYLKRSAGLRNIDIWCAASSTGEEPYSIAMTAREALGTVASKVKIVASDIDTNVLTTASAGVYGDERVEGIDREQLKRFFMKGTGEQAGKVRVRDVLREMVTFRRINLLDKEWPVRPGFDVVFCRNILIYFDVPTQLVILERFTKLMRPGGLLFTGHSESLHQAPHLFRLRGKSVYEVVDRSAAAA